MNLNLKIFKNVYSTRSTFKIINNNNNNTNIIHQSTTTTLSKPITNSIQLSSISIRSKNQLDLGLFYKSSKSFTLHNSTIIQRKTTSLEINQSRQKMEFAKRPKRINNASGPELLQYIGKVTCRFWPSHPRSGSVRY